MATLAIDKRRTFEAPATSPTRRAMPIVGSDIIYAGAAVGDDGTGNARPLVAGDVFLGFAVDQADNSGGAAGDKNVKLWQRGALVLSVAGIVGAGDMGATVYASDDDTFTLTPTSNSLVGKVRRYESGATALVVFEAASARSI